MDTLTILIFGIIDNLVMCLAFYFTYLCLEVYIEKFFKTLVSAFLLGIISAGLSNTISDGLGFFLQMEFYFGFVVMLGCLLGMLIIPFMEFIKYIKKRNKKCRLHPNIHIWGTSTKSKTDED